MKFGNGIWRLLYPLRCPVCDGAVSPAGAGICYECRKKLRFVSGPVCAKCGKELKEAGGIICCDCERHPHLYTAGAALFEYDCIKESVFRFKYEGRREYAEFYGEETVRYLGRQIRKWNPDALIPVPLHPSRQRVRGYNQAELLACQIGRRMGIPVRPDVVVRSVNTVPQKTLNPEERQNNLKRAFKLYENDVKLKTIIIIDDIYTTGSTVDAVSRAFLGTSVDRIYYVALAIGRGL